MDLNAAIIARIDALLPQGGLLELESAGIKLAVRSRTCAPVKCLYDAMMLYMASGAKTTSCNEHEHRCGAGEVMLYAIDMPAMTAVSEASAAEPMRCIGVELDFDTLLAQNDRLQNAARGQRLSAFAEGAALEYAEQYLEEDRDFVRVFKAEHELQEILLRLLDLSLSHQPGEAVRIRAELYRQELMLCLLQSSVSSYLTELLRAESTGNRILKAVHYIKNNFKGECNIEELPELCCMAPSTFYRKFSKLTGMPPLQYLKQLRLFEARRLLSSGVTAQRAASQVGYVSPNQFSREFKRLFGMPPSQVFSA